MSGFDICDSKSVPTFRIMHDSSMDISSMDESS